jgi:hypothetical protein
VLRLVAIGVAGGILAVSLLVAALQNPYLRPRTTILGEAMAASPHKSDEKPPQARLVQNPDAPQRDSAGRLAKPPATSSPAVPPLAASRSAITPLADRVAPAPPMQDRRARLSSADGLAAHAETVPGRKDDAAQKPDVMPPPAYPLPPPAHLAAFVRATPVAEPQKALSASPNAALQNEQPPKDKRGDRASPKGQTPKGKGQKQAQPPLPPERGQSIRIAKTHENVRVTMPDRGKREGVLSAKSRTGQPYPDVRVIYGTRSSADVVDGPRIIRLK